MLSESSFGHILWLYGYYVVQSLIARILLASSRTISRVSFSGQMTKRTSLCFIIIMHDICDPSFLGTCPAMLSYSTSLIFFHFSRYMRPSLSLLPLTCDPGHNDSSEATSWAVNSPFDTSIRACCPSLVF